MSRLLESLRVVPNFPKEGISFKDITSWYEDPELLRELRSSLIELVLNKNLKCDALIAIEARGFLSGAILADRLHIPLYLVRKQGKLPSNVIEVPYTLEYGKDSLELPVNSVKEGDTVIIHDDILATGGTAEAVYKAVSFLKPKKVLFLFLLELIDENLSGRKVLESLGCEVISLFKI